MVPHTVADTHASQDDPLKEEFQDHHPVTYTTTRLQGQKTIEGWPRGPTSLQRSISSWLVDLSPHVFLLLLPTGSIGLAIAVLLLNGHNESASGNAILRALTIIATNWPILFAAVVGPLVKAIALHRAQRGTTLGELEILYTSQTLVSTLRGCFTLRIVSLWPVILVLVWALSPLGAQGALKAAMLRENIKALDYNLSSYPVSDLKAYENGTFNAGVAGLSFLENQYQAPAWAAFASQDLGLHHANGSSNGFAAVLEKVGGLEEAAIITRRDLWRNVRVPFLRSLPGYSTEQNDWISIQDNTIPDYSSLIGIPMRGFPALRSGNASAIIETSYQTVTCNAPWAAADDVLSAYNQSFPNSTESDVLPGPGKPTLKLLRIDDLERTRAIYSEPSPVEPPSRLHLMIGTIRNLTVCEVGTEYVQAQIRCSRAADNANLACFVEKMRHDPKFSGSGNLTALDIGKTFFLLNYIPYTFANDHPGYASILEKWLKNPPTAFNTSESLHIGDDFWYKDVSLEVFAGRFAMVLNTHLRASLEMSYTVGSDDTAPKSDSQSWAQTKVTWTEFAEPTYHVHWAWFLLYLLSAVVLAICASANIILRTIIYIPDFLGSISSLTRDSHYIDIPSPGSTLNPSDRSRLLRDKRVMVQDVQPDEVVGRIALSDAPQFVPIQKERQYI